MSRDSFQDNRIRNFASISETVTRKEEGASKSHNILVVYVTQLRECRIKITCVISKLYCGPEKREGPAVPLSLLSFDRAVTQRMFPLSSFEAR